MTEHAKKQLAGVISLVCIIGMTSSLARILPLGLSGQIALAKPYIYIFCVSFVIGLPASAAYQYYRARPQDDPELQRMRTEINTLASSAPPRKSTASTHHEPIDQ